jgi:hypothetical protein
MDEDGLIYDGNTAGDFLFPAPGKVMPDDETLRDVLQNPSVHGPAIEEKFEILHLMEDLGFEMTDIGLPVKIQLNCTTRTGPFQAESLFGVFMFDRRAGMVDTEKPATKRALVGAAK